MGYQNDNEGPVEHKPRQKPTKLFYVKIPFVLTHKYFIECYSEEQAFELVKAGGWEGEELEYEAHLEGVLSEMKICELQETVEEVFKDPPGEKKTLRGRRAASKCPKSQ